MSQALSIAVELFDSTIVTAHGVRNQYRVTAPRQAANDSPLASSAETSIGFPLTRLAPMTGFICISDSAC